MPRKFYRHKLILDEGFHLRSRFPILNSRFDLKHVAADFKKSSMPDPQVYQLARAEKRLLVTYNIKDFKRFARESKETGIIGVSPNLSLDQIDKKLTSILTKAGRKELVGKLTMINS